MSKRKNRGGEFMSSPDMMGETVNQVGMLDKINQNLGYEGEDSLFLARSGNTAKISSAHHGFVACDTKALRGESGKRVFVKPYMPSKAKNAEQEVSSLKYAADIMEDLDDKNLSMKVVRPHKETAVAAGEYGHAVVTDFLPGLVTMDHELKRMTKEEWPFALQYMGLYTGLLHGRGIIHNDLQPKNIGQHYNYDFMQISGLKQETGVTWGQPVLFDLENMVITDPRSVDGVVRAQHEQACEIEVANLLQKLVSEGFMNPKQVPDFEEMVLQNFMAAYTYAGGSEKILNDDRTWDAIYGQMTHHKGYVPPRRPVLTGVR